MYQDDDDLDLGAIDFESFARIVAVVLEDANKINEVGMEEEGIEESFHNDKMN